MGIWEQIKGKNEPIYFMDKAITFTVLSLLLDIITTQFL